MLVISIKILFFEEQRPRDHVFLIQREQLSHGLYALVKYLSLYGLYGLVKYLFTRP